MFLLLNIKPIVCHFFLKKQGGVYDDEYNDDPLILIMDIWNEIFIKSVVYVEIS